MSLLLKSSEIDGVYFFHCPGCGCSHWFSTTGKTPGNPTVENSHLKWSFNGSMEKPTVRASILVKSTRNITNDEHARIMAGEKLNIPPTLCHSFITDGQIQYLGDCTHHLSGKTVDMEDYDL